MCGGLSWRLGTFGALCCWALRHELGCSARRRLRGQEQVPHRRVAGGASAGIQQRPHTVRVSLRACHIPTHSALTLHPWRDHSIHVEEYDGRMTSIAGCISGARRAGARVGEMCAWVLRYNVVEMLPGCG